MARFASTILLLIAVATPAMGQSVGHKDEWRIREVIAYSEDPKPPSFELGSNARFGPGIFGLKSQTPRRRSVIANEVNAPKQRRAGVGFSLKF